MPINSHTEWPIVRLAATWQEVDWGRLSSNSLQAEENPRIPSIVFIETCSCDSCFNPEVISIVFCNTGFQSNQALIIETFLETSRMVNGGRDDSLRPTKPSY